MEITIYLEKKASTKKVLFKGKTVADLLAKLNLNQETVLVVRKDQVLTKNESLKPKDKIEILSVVSGG